MINTEDTLERSRGSTTNAAVDANELDAVSRLTLVYQIIVYDHVRTPRQLASRRSLRHLLDTDALVITESAEAILYL